ncbi:HAMP domain-containing histidine kinase [Parapedobacter sp. SGR-10]|uniref:sensor histidine kinase n=1 Tax=Parapedobacter sp. SGR-10 TaxID=2710879 RepID=UPI0013D3F52E|nr:HAMP domain-containing sensor histidine kinase [Parapedobacter sp. SGR-10]NGF56012.1 HAMP domain-containing histidine kinase [Parapedobacter sp. SGR-10]
MDPYKYNKQLWKILLLVFAALLAASSLLYTNYLVKNLSKSERTKAEVWAMSTRSIVTMPDIDDQFISFIYAVRDSLSLPAIITDEKRNIIFWRDLDPTKTNIAQEDSVHNQLKYDPDYFQKQLKDMERRHPPITIKLETGEKWYVYYQESNALRQLRIFPYIQWFTIAIFLVIAYSIFNSIKKSEQNLVWVGMAKEAAHQLGTPLSSLMGWLELLRLKYGETEKDNVMDEMERDVKRLEIVADRFSKIGSTPVLSNHNVYNAVNDFIQYFKVRTSDKILFELQGDKHVEAGINVPLFDWIIENLLKNAVNAIDKEGKITVNISENIAKEEIFIDISDTGKGISRSNFERIFQPGFTTRKRGWGLGLTLTKRMVDYHGGQIFVKESETGKGTTFRIVLKSNLRYEPTQV